MGVNVLSASLCACLMPAEPSKGYQMPQRRSPRRLFPITWLMEIEPVSSEGAAGALSVWATSPV